MTFGGNNGLAIASKITSYVYLIALSLGDCLSSIILTSSSNSSLTFAFESASVSIT